MGFRGNKVRTYVEYVELDIAVDDLRSNEVYSLSGILMFVCVRCFLSISASSPDDCSVICPKSCQIGVPFLVNCPQVSFTQRPNLRGA